MGQISFAIKEQILRSADEIISFIRDRLNFPMATYNTIVMYDFHNKLQKKAPERLKNLERLRILIYSATIPAGAAADRLGASTCIPIRSPFRECPP